jgi:hypothetical protein
MNRNLLKYLAVVAMLSDHIALAFIGMDKPLGIAMRVFGRLTAPIMCYFLVEGFMHTRSKKKYALRLLSFAFISQVPFSYFVTGRLLAGKLNMIFTLFFCFMMLTALYEAKNRFLRVSGTLGFAYLCSLCDWGVIAPLWVLVFAVFREDKKKVSLFYILTCIFWLGRCISLKVAEGDIWYSALWQAGTLGFIPFIHLYNGQAGKSSKFSKWFFYCFYPIHIFIIAIIRRNILPYI